MTTTAQDFDFKGTYTVAGYGGVAWYAVEHDHEWTEESWEFVGADEDDIEDESLYLYNEPEEVENTSRVRAVMVGDDRVFVFDVEDMTALDELDYCAECGQIGCTADGRDRS